MLPVGLDSWQSFNVGRQLSSRPAPSRSSICPTVRLGRAILDGQLWQSLRLLYHCRAGVHTLHRQYLIFRTWTLTGLHSLGAVLQAPFG